MTINLLTCLLFSRDENSLLKGTVNYCCFAWKVWLMDTNLYSLITYYSLNVPFELVPVSNTDLMAIIMNSM